MIQIDMPMPKNCSECPVCNEYISCAIPVEGRGWGENDVREYDQDRPDWCPLKEITYKKRLCPNCLKDEIRWDSSEDMQDIGCYEPGIVDFYHCENCGASIEIYVPSNPE